MSDEKSGLNRREFLRKAAVTTAAAAWAAPVVRSIAATPAFAQVNGTPFCGHSVGGDGGEGCMGACTSSGAMGELCNGRDPDPNNTQFGEGPCQWACPSGQGGDNPCCNPGFCDPNNFYFVPGMPYVEYTGALNGCPGYPNNDANNDSNLRP